MCQKPGRFFRFERARRAARIRNVFLEPFAPMYLERRFWTEGREERPMRAAEVVRRPAIVDRRVAADMMGGDMGKERSRGKKGTDYG